jgi:hypothetical protein
MTDDELEPTGQARLNVVFEAGMAMALDRDRVVIVEVGQVRKMSDTAGLNVIRLHDNIDPRKDLAARLKAAGLAVDDTGEDWRTAGTFDSRRCRRGIWHHRSARRQPVPQVAEA